MSSVQPGSDPDKLPLPTAPPGAVRDAITTLFDQWKSINKERQEWQLERAQMRARILQLEAESRTHEQIRLDLIRRIKLLEHGLLQERAQYVSGAPPSKFQLGFHPTKGPKGKAADSNSLSGYRTLPRNFMGRSGGMQNASPGRVFLREYLIELGYLKEAAQLDRGLQQRADGKEAPVKQRKKEAKTPASPPSGGSYARKSKPKPVHSRRVSHSELGISGPKSDSKRWKAANAQLRSHLDGVRCLSFHAHEPLLLSGSEDCTAKLWNIQSVLTERASAKKESMEPIYTFRGHSGMVTACEVADKRGLCFTASTDSTVMVWDLPTKSQDPYGSDGQCLKFKRSVLSGHSDAVWDVCAHPLESMDLLFSASADGVVGTWKLQQPDSMARQFTHKDTKGVQHTPSRVAVVRSDMKKVAVSYTSGQLLLVDIETGKLVRAMADSGNSHITDLVSHPTLPLVVTAHADNNVRVFDVNEGKCVHVFPTHRDMVTSVSIDQSGQYLVSASHDQSVRFWDLTTKKIMQDLDGYQTHRKKFDEAIHCVRYHPTLPFVASAGADSVVKVYV